MATLLMRTHELSSSTDDIALPSHAHACLHVTETAPLFSRLPASDPPLGKGSGACGGRTRRAKSAQKKQPQRGLGVAQLEKLRLQEQSKQEAASLATLQGVQSLPLNSSSYAYSDPCSPSLGLQAAVSCHVKGSSACHLCSELCLIPSLSLAISGNCPHTSFASLSDSKASPSLAPLKSSPQSFSVASPRLISSVPGMHERPSDDESALSSLDLHSLNGTVSSISERAVGKVCSLEKLDGETRGKLEADSGVTPGALGRRDSVLKYTTNASPVYDMFGGVNDTFEDHLKADEGEEGGILVNPLRVGGGTEALRLYPIATCATNGEGTQCTFVDFVDSGGVHVAASSSYIRKTRGLDPMCHQVASDKPKELSSFQILSSDGPWSPGEKTHGVKRSWVTMQDQHHPPGSFFSSLMREDDNGTAVRTKYDRISAVNALHDLRGIHYTTGIVRTTSGKTSSCMSHGKVTQSSFAPQRQDSGSPSSASGCLSDISCFSTPTSLSRLCTGKNGCASASLRSPNLIAAWDAEELSEIGVSTSNFLSLGVSSSTYLALPTHSPRKTMRQVTDQHTAEQDIVSHSTSTSCLNDRHGGKRQCYKKYSEIILCIPSQRLVRQFWTEIERWMPTGNRCVLLSMLGGSCPVVVCGQDCLSYLGQHRDSVARFL